MELSQTSHWNDGDFTESEVFLREPVISDVDVLALLQLAGELLVGLAVVELERAGLVLGLVPGQQLDEEDAELGGEGGWAGHHLDPLDLVGLNLDLPPPLVPSPLCGGAGCSVWRENMRRVWRESNN